MSNISAAEAYKIIFTNYPDVVGIKEASEMLGVCCKKVYQLINNGEISIIPCCRTYRIAKIHIIEYLLVKAK